MDYGQLLDYAYENVKTPNGNGERFDMPKMRVEIIGNKTVISNFSQICGYIRRDEEEVCKFLSKELATQCKKDGDRLILNRKIPVQQVIDKINLYVRKFVLCPSCKKPDTEILRESGSKVIHCLACGAKKSLGSN